MTNKEIYFDNAASTYIYEEVVQHINKINTEFFANPSSTHLAGISSFEQIKKMKENFCEILHIKPSSLIFTSGGAESNNFAIKSVAFANMLKSYNIVISSYEHPSVMNTAYYLEKFGFEIRVCHLNEFGHLDLDMLKKLVDNNTILVSTAHVCSETGSVTDIKKISDIIKAINRKCYYHVDAVQSLGKFPINLSMYNNIDLMSFSSHKIHGPKGVGALYIKPKVKIDPFIIGSQSAGLRAGTLNTSGICGFCLALSIIDKNRESNYIKTQILRKYLIDELNSAFSDDIFLVSPMDGSPYILNIAFRSIKSEVLLNALSQKSIYVSSGSACNSKTGISKTLKAMNIPKDFIEGAIRISFCDLNTTDEVDIFIENLRELIPMLQLFVRR